MSSSSCLFPSQCVSYCVFAELKLVYEQPRVRSVWLADSHCFIGYCRNLCSVSTIVRKSATATVYSGNINKWTSVTHKKKLILYSLHSPHHQPQYLPADILLSLPLSVFAWPPFPQINTVWAGAPKSGPLCITEAGYTDCMSMSLLTPNHWWRSTEEIQTKEIYPLNFILCWSTNWPMTRFISAQQHHNHQ